MPVFEEPSHRYGKLPDRMHQATFICPLLSKRLLLNKSVKM